MRLIRACIVVALLCGAVGRTSGSSAGAGRLSEPESAEVEREVEAGLKELEDEPTAEELAKVKVHVSIPKTDAEGSGEAKPKLGKPSWREAVQAKIDGANRALALLLKTDAESKVLRAQLAQLKDEEAEPEEISRQQKVVEDNLEAIREAREGYHRVIQQLAWLAVRVRRDGPGQGAAGADPSACSRTRTPASTWARGRATWRTRWWPRRMSSSGRPPTTGRSSSTRRWAPLGGCPTRTTRTRRTSCGTSGSPAGSTRCR